MAITDSSLEQLVERVRNSFRAYLPNSDSWLFPNNLWVTATVIGGLFWEAMSIVRRMPDTILPDTATGDYLERWGAVYGVSRELETPAFGDVRVSGLSGTLIPEGTVFVASNGDRYLATADSTVDDGGTTDVPVQSEASGEDLNLLSGTPLTLANVIAGALSAQVGAGGLSGGQCDESDDDLRERILTKMRASRRYGTLCDFRGWALEVPGVKRAWTKQSKNGVVVQVELDESGSLQAVFDYVTDDCRKPACVPVRVLCVIPQTIMVVLACEDAQTAEQQAILQKLLQDHITDTAAPGLGYSANDLERALCDVDKSIAILNGDFPAHGENHVISTVVVEYG